MLNYLFLADSRRGKLVNFRAESVQSRFVNAVSPREERRQFSVDVAQWRESSFLPDLVVELLQDWGTGLELSFYRQAPSQATCLQPLARNGIALGSQTFDLVTPDSALRLSAYEETPPSFAPHLRRLLHLTPLRALHWINFAPHRLTFTTLQH